MTLKVNNTPGLTELNSKGISSLFQLLSFENKENPNVLFMMLIRVYVSGTVLSKLQTILNPHTVQL